MVVVQEEAMTESKVDEDGFAEEDYATVGREVIASIESNRSHPFLKHWMAMQTPSEIVTDLLNEIDERSATLQARIEMLRGALEILADAERDYRVIHDLQGDGHMDTGRAWDHMRWAGDRAREFLAATAPTEGGNDR
jgi:hypothetical protein